MTEVRAAVDVVGVGGGFPWKINAVPWSFSFTIWPRFAGEASYAYQIERMKFDLEEMVREKLRSV